MLSLAKIDTTEGHHPRIKWDPLDDYLERAILFNFIRVFRKLNSIKHPSSIVENDTISITFPF